MKIIEVPDTVLIIGVPETGTLREKDLVCEGTDGTNKISES